MGAESVKKSHQLDESKYNKSLLRKTCGRTGSHVICIFFQYHVVTGEI